MAGAEGLIRLRCPKLITHLSMLSILTAAPSPPRCFSHCERFGGSPHGTLACLGFIALLIQKDRSEGFFRLPNDVFRIQLDAYEFKLYAYLVCRAGTKGECWPSIPTMSEQLGMSKTTVQKKLKELEDRGFIKKINDSGLGKNGQPRKFNNHYIVREFDVPWGAAINRHKADPKCCEIYEMKHCDS